MVHGRLQSSWLQLEPTNEKSIDSMKRTPTLGLLLNTVGILLITTPTLFSISFQVSLHINHQSKLVNLFFSLFAAHQHYWSSIAWSINSSTTALTNHQLYCSRIIPIISSFLLISSWSDFKCVYYSILYTDCKEIIELHHHTVYHIIISMLCINNPKVTRNRHRCTIILI